MKKRKSVTAAPETLQSDPAELVNPNATPSPPAAAPALNAVATVEAMFAPRGVSPAPNLFVWRGYQYAGELLPNGIRLNKAALANGLVQPGDAGKLKAGVASWQNVLVGEVKGTGDALDLELFPGPSE